MRMKVFLWLKLIQWLEECSNEFDDMNHSAKNDMISKILPNGSK